MIITYNNGSEVFETFETVYTYEEWLKEYNRRETKQKMKKRKETIHAYVTAIIIIIIPILFILHWLLFGY